MRLPRLLSAVPQSWPVRLEIAKAMRTLTEQVEDKEQRIRHGEVAAVVHNNDLLVEAIREFRKELWRAAFNPNKPRVPAGNSDGGQWTREGGSRGSRESDVVSDATPENTWISGARYSANDAPGSGHPPNVPLGRPSTAQAVNSFLKTAAYFLAGATLAGEPAGELILALEAADWLSQYLPLVYSYLDAPKTLEELQQAAQNPQPGYNIHHIVEQTPAERDGFPWSVIDSPENLVLIPTLKHWQINGWYGTPNDEFGGLCPRDYLRGKSWEERTQVGEDALVLFGVLQP